MIKMRKNNIHRLENKLLKNGPVRRFFRKYRITVDDIHFQKTVRSFSMSHFRVTLIVVLILIVAFAGSYVSYRFIPSVNIEKDYDKDELLHTFFHIDSLEAAIKVRDIYISNLKDIFEGNVKPDTLMNIDSLAVFMADSLLVPGKIETEFVENLSQSGQSPVIGSIEYILRDMYSPVQQGHVVRHYNAAKEQYNVALKVEKGTYVVSPQYGWVVFADNSQNDGNVIVICHANNSTSVFRNCGSMVIKAGERVNAGEAVSQIPQTGNNGNLIYELWYDGEAVNPEKYIEFIEE